MQQNKQTKKTLQTVGMKIIIHCLSFTRPSSTTKQKERKKKRIKKQKHDKVNGRQMIKKLQLQNTKENISP